MKKDLFFRYEGGAVGTAGSLQHVGERVTHSLQWGHPHDSVRGVAHLRSSVYPRDGRFSAVL